VERVRAHPASTTTTTTTGDDLMTSHLQLFDRDYAEALVKLNLWGRAPMVDHIRELEGANAFHPEDIDVALSLAACRAALERFDR
jgi:hypothetical protein